MTRRKNSLRDSSSHLLPSLPHSLPILPLLSHPSFAGHSHPNISNQLSATPSSARRLLLLLTLLLRRRRRNNSRRDPFEVVRYVPVVVLEQAGRDDDVLGGGRVDDFLVGEGRGGGGQLKGRKREGRKEEGREVSLSCHSRDDEGMEGTPYEETCASSLLL